jgi:subtilisin family serine protease
MYKSIPVILAAILVIIFAASTGQGQHGALVGLSPDESINPLPEARFTAEPAKCRNVGRDCVPGEFLAILKNSNAANDAIENDFKTLINVTGSPVIISEVIPYQLEKKAISSSQPYNVCGQVLLRIKFTPANKVNEAMKFVSGRLPPGIALISRSTVLGIGPVGIGRPSLSSTSEPRPELGSVADATMMIGAQSSLIRSNQLLPPVTVAVLDTGWNNVTPGIINVSTGLAWDLTDLTIPLPPKGGRVTDDLIDPPGVGHGTPIASIIGSKDQSIGVAPNARIVPIKICNKDGNCNEASAIIGMCYAMSINASVINMSFAGRTPLPDAAGEIHIPIFEGLVNDAARAGVLLVAAAGNSRDETFILAHPNETVANEALYPAVLSSGSILKDAAGLPPPFGSGLLSVGAIYTDLYYAGFATYNDHVDLAAPGSWVRAIGEDGQLKGNMGKDATSVNVSGTSFAAAYVSGAAALLIGHNAVLPTPEPYFTATKLAKLMLEDGVINRRGCGHTISGSTECGAGTLDVSKAWEKQGP